jgi:hypothetical protein
MVYFLKDDRSVNETETDLRIKKIWHLANLGLNIWCSVLLGRCFGWQWVPVTSSTIWVFFDGSVNRWVLNKEWFYIGTTAQVDIAQRKLANIFHLDPIVMSAILKIMFFVTSIVFAFTY